MAISCAKPSTACSGVRNSWLTRERNSDFARSAAAARSRSSRRVSACLVAVMSRITPTRALTPSSAGTGALATRIQRISPLGNTQR